MGKSTKQLALLGPLGLATGSLIDANRAKKQATSSFNAQQQALQTSAQSQATAEDEKKKRLASMQYQNPFQINNTQQTNTFSPFKTLLGQ